MVERKYIVSPETAQSLQDALAKISEQYNRSMAEIAESLKQASIQNAMVGNTVSSAVQKVLEEWKQRQIVIAESFTSIQPLRIELNGLREIVESVTGIAASVQKAFEPVMRELAEMDIDAHEMEPVFAEAGFWMTPSMPIDIFRGARQLKEQGQLTPDSLKNMILEDFRGNDGQLLREMVEGWYDSPRFEARKHIISDALDAHLSGKYTLSVPTLVPQVEAIVIETVEGRYGELEYAAKLVVQKALLTEGLMAPVASGVFCKELQKFYSGTTNKEFSPEKFPNKIQRDWQREPSNILNRPAISHGVQIDYESEENSLRAFLLLDTLHGLSDEKADT